MIEHIYLPVEKSCTLKFLQQIMVGKKWAYAENDVVRRRIPFQIEFSVAVVMQNKYLDALLLSTYFPDNPEVVDRQFMWEVWLTARPEAANKYYDAVINSKQIKKAIPAPKTMEIPEDWLDDLF